MADGEVKIDTKLDTSGVDKGLKDLKVSLKNLGVETSKETKKQDDFNKSLEDTKEKAEEAGKAVEKSTKKNKNLGDILKTVKSKISATTVAGVAATVAIKKTVDALNECAAAYRTQVNAEESLALAAKNNPYLNNESVYNLKNFASELQSMSEIGDEVSMSVMSQLAAAGRKEEEIMQIMSAAADMAAVTGEDIESAALKLSATLNGNAGQLGRQIKAIDNLTQKQLENGEAIKLVAQQYKGAAAATADVEVQLANSWGDFKENIGRGWQNATQPVKEFFLDVLNSINEATAKTNALKDAKSNDTAGTATAADTKILLDDAQNRLTQLKEINKNYVQETEETTQTLEQLQAEWDAKYGKMNARMRRESGAPSRPTSTDTTNKKGGAYNKAVAEENKKEIENLEAEVQRLTDQYTKLKDEEDKAAEAAQKAAEAANKKTAAQKRDEEASKYISDNVKALNEQIKAIELKAATTKQEVAAGDMYNAYLQSYLDLISKSNGLVTENNQAAKNRLATLEEWAKKAKETEKNENLLNLALKAQTESEALLLDIKNKSNNTYFDEYEKRNKEIDKLKKEVNQSEVLSEEQKTQVIIELEKEKEKIKKNEILTDQERLKALEDIDETIDKLNNNEILSEQQKTDAMLAIDKAYAQNKADLFNNITAEVNGYAQQVSQIINDAAKMALDISNNETKAELANLEIKYRKGELGEEEYQKKVAEAKKKGAETQYKIEMAQWSANILSAMANTAVGVTQALAQGGVAGIISGVLVGAAGAVQLASIMAAKPVKHFAAGGVVGGMNGASMGADNTTIAARSGEMIMNANQQRALWDMLNGSGNSAGAGGVNLTINNSAANLVSAQPQITRGQIELMIDARVNDGLRNGRFDGGLNAASAGMSGDFYGM